MTSDELNSARIAFEQYVIKQGADVALIDSLNKSAWKFFLAGYNAKNKAKNHDEAQYFVKDRT